MEIKKAQPVTSPKVEDAAAKATSMIDFIGDIKTEVQKISWTSSEELRVYTKIVVASTFALGLGIYLMDLIIQATLSGISAIFHWIV